MRSLGDTELTPLKLPINSGKPRCFNVMFDLWKISIRTTNVKNPISTHDFQPLSCWDNVATLTVQGLAGEAIA